MSTVTITITVQSGADVSVTGAASSGAETADVAGAPPAPLAELGSPTEGAADEAGQPPEDLEVLGDTAAETSSAQEPLPLEELTAEDQGMGEVAPGPMPLEKLEKAAKASASGKGGKKGSD